MRVATGKNYKNRSTHGHTMATSSIVRCLEFTGPYTIISMGWCKKDETPLLTHWSYVLLALTNRYFTWTQQILDKHNVENERSSYTEEKSLNQLFHQATPTSYSLQWRHNERDGVSNHQPHDCLLDRLFGHRSKKTSKLRVTGLCAGNSPGTGEFPEQRVSNAENVSISWRHHVPAIFHQRRCSWC